ncbi:molybdenum cofactor guanylyltransferase [Soehngenia longivitae]|nr:molybdenum cofactor guanylyltransferase [Soehngenia longivitae]
MLENSVNSFGSAIILAGGKSMRMGFDKQFLKLENKSNVELLIEKLSPLFNDFIIVTNKPNEYDDEKIKYEKIKLVSDEIKDKGPLSGIHIGLKESKSKYAYLIACDMPIVNLDYIRYMMALLKIKESDAVVTEDRIGIEPFNAFYSRDLYKVIELYLNNDKIDIKTLLQTVNTTYIPHKKALKMSPDWSMFLNLNTKEDLEKYERSQSR